MAIIAVAAANAVGPDEGNLASDQLLVGVGNRRPAAPPDATGADEEAIDRDLDARAGVVLATLDGAPTVALDVVLSSSATGGLGEPIDVGERIDQNTIRHLGSAYVATPAVLDFFGIDPAAIDPDTDVLIAADRPIELVDTTRRPEPDTSTVVQVSDRLPAYAAAPFALVTEAAMERHGWKSARTAWFAQLTEPVNSAQHDAAIDAAATVDLEVTTRDDQDSLSSLKVWTTGAGVLLAIAIVAMTVGLIRGEAAADLRTLAATGAAPRTRRALAAATATALALLGALLGIVGAYVVLIASYRTTLDVLVPVPVLPLLTLAVGLPVAAGAAGWCCAGREPPAISRRALD